jgi:hypothetical protein
LTVAVRLGSNENETVPSDTEIRNRRITAVVLVLGAAIAVLAVADVGPFADETEEDRVREAVERFIAARDEGDLVTVCGMLTPTLKRQVQATSGARPGTRPPTCAQVLDARAEAEPDRERASELEIVDVSVSGNRARASVERTEGISRSLTLELIDGEWLIATFES